MSGGKMAGLLTSAFCAPCVKGKEAQSASAANNFVKEDKWKILLLRFNNAAMQEMKVVLSNGNSGARNFAAGKFLGLVNLLVFVSVMLH